MNKRSDNHPDNRIPEMDLPLTPLEKYVRLMANRPSLFAPSPLIPLVTDKGELESYAAENHVPLGVVYESPFHLLLVDLIDDPEQGLYTYERLVPAIDNRAVVAIPVLSTPPKTKKATAASSDEKASDSVKSTDTHRAGVQSASDIPRYILLDQFRHAGRQMELAFPRGFGEPGLSSEENLKKELWEELHMDVTGCRFLGSVSGDSGISSAKADVYLAFVQPPSIQKKQPPHEGIRERLFLTKEQMQSYIRNGHIQDGFTLSAWCLLTESESRLQL